MSALFESGIYDLLALETLTLWDYMYVISVFGLMELLFLK